MNFRLTTLLPLVGLFGLISCKPGVQAERSDRERLDRFYNNLAVESHWLAGRHVDWRSGEPDGKPVPKTGYHTHCSAFVAAACERLGVYILRPPQHPQEFLADAQADWLKSNDGKQAGWVPIGAANAAQTDANSGYLVIAIYKNPDPKQAGHIALVRPGNKSANELRKEGVNIIQAGRTNFQRTNLKRGFEHHPDAREKAELRYYAHKVQWETFAKPAD